MKVLSFLLEIKVVYLQKNKICFMEDKLQKGELVKFWWVDAYYPNNVDLEVTWEGELEGIYDGYYYDDQKFKLAIVRVTTEGQYCGKTLHPFVYECKKIETSGVAHE